MISRSAVAISLVPLLVGCAIPGPCETRLDRSWVPALAPEMVELIGDTEYQWFSNSSGNYVGCAQLRGQRVCGYLRAYYSAETGETEETLCMS